MERPIFSRTRCSDLKDSGAEAFLNQVLLIVDWQNHVHPTRLTRGYTMCVSLRLRLLPWSPALLVLARAEAMMKVTRTLSSAAWPCDLQYPFMTIPPGLLDFLRYVLLCSVWILAGRGILRLARHHVLEPTGWLLAPSVTQAAVAVALGMSAVLGSPIRNVSSWLWTTRRIGCVGTASRMDTADQQR